MPASISASRPIAAPADQVWSMVSDLPRMGEWSPENTGGSWTHGASGPAVGATFKGTNANGKKRWSTQVKVTTCEPGRAFGFAVSAAGFSVASWDYTIEADPSGCVVTETWTDTRNWLATKLGGLASGVNDRETFTRGSIETTLANLASAVAPKSV
jgi:hypothetical protein